MGRWLCGTRDATWIDVSLRSCVTRWLGEIGWDQGTLAWWLKWTFDPWGHDGGDLWESLEIWENYDIMDNIRYILYIYPLYTHVLLESMWEERMIRKTMCSQVDLNLGVWKRWIASIDTNALRWRWYLGLSWQLDNWIRTYTSKLWVSIISLLRGWVQI